jgi:uroporphyrinogen-III synthase
MCINSDSSAMEYCRYRAFGSSANIRIEALRSGLNRVRLAGLDNAETIPLKSAHVAVQEHGVPSRELYAGLAKRGAQVFPVPVYKRAPTENPERLREVIRDLALGKFDVVLLTSSVQVHHWFQFADEMGQHQEAADALRPRGGRVDRAGYVGDPA